MASLVWKGIARPSKKATVVPGELGLTDDWAKQAPASFRRSVSYGGPVPLTYIPYANAVPASQTVASLAGVYGSVAAAQDICANDLKCLGVRSQERGTIALLYPGCSKPKMITDMDAAPGTTTWVKQKA